MKGRSAGAKSAGAKKVKGAPAEEHEPDGTECGTRSETKTELVEKEAAGTALRPAQCRRYLKQRLAAEFPGIVQGFVEGAKAGSCAHVKLVTELLGEPEPTRSRRKGSAARLLEQMGRS